MSPEEQRLTTGINNLLAEYARSCAIHTDWAEYAEHSVYEAVEDEFLEYRAAVLRNLTTGPHDQSTEALQLAVVALKAHIYHERNRTPHG